MAYDQGLAERVRAHLSGLWELDEKKMFGGLCIMVSGHMCCGILGENLMVRVGKENYSRYLAEPSVTEMTFTGKPLSGFLYVLPEGISEDQDLVSWLQRCLDFVATLPPKGMK